MKRALVIVFAAAMGGGCNLWCPSMVRWEDTEDGHTICRDMTTGNFAKDECCEK